uniref:Uncharacterized protein n=1 Tax=Oryza brachyantha TaxID=4533 RepID=J3N8F2_ORYBR
MLGDACHRRVGFSFFRVKEKKEKVCVLHLHNIYIINMVLFVQRTNLCNVCVSLSIE